MRVNTHRFQSIACLVAGLTSCVLGGGLGCSGSVPSQDRAPGTELTYAGDTARCDQEARRLADERTHSGVASAEVAAQLQRDLVRCSGPDVEKCTAVVVGAANQAHQRLTGMLLSQRITPSDYVRALRAFDRKVKRSESEPDYCRALMLGDSDGDLVPNSLDECPDSPELSAVGTSGCPLPPAERAAVIAPDAKSMAAALDKLGLFIHPTCAAAPAPNMPEPLLLAAGPCLFGTARCIAIHATSVTNQPADCPVYYEVSTAIPMSDPSRNSYGHAIFRGQPVADGRQRFFLPPDSLLGGGNPNTFDLQPPGRREVARAGLSLASQWRVRAINAAGLASRWSRFVDGRP